MGGSAKLFIPDEGSLQAIYKAVYRDKDQPDDSNCSKYQEQIYSVGVYFGLVVCGLSAIGIFEFLLYQLGNGDIVSYIPFLLALVLGLSILSYSFTSMTHSFTYQETRKKNYLYRAKCLWALIKDDAQIDSAHSTSVIRGFASMVSKGLTNTEKKENQVKTVIHGFGASCLTSFLILAIQKGLSNNNTINDIHQMVLYGVLAYVVGVAWIISIAVSTGVFTQRKAHLATLEELCWCLLHYGEDVKHADRPDGDGKGFRFPSVVHFVIPIIILTIVAFVDDVFVRVHYQGCLYWSAYLVIFVNCAIYAFEYLPKQMDEEVTIGDCKALDRLMLHGDSVDRSFRSYGGFDVE